jgi:hypothetical protein
LVSGRPDFATSAPSVTADQDERSFSRRRGAAQFPSAPIRGPPFASQASTSKSALSPARQRISSSRHRARPTPGAGNGVDGNGGAAGANNGASGGSSSLGTVCTANGGSGGATTWRPAATRRRAKCSHSKCNSGETQKPDRAHLVRHSVTQRKKAQLPKRLAAIAFRLTRCIFAQRDAFHT